VTRVPETRALNQLFKIWHQFLAHLLMLVWYRYCIWTVQ